MISSETLWYTAVAGVLCLAMATFIRLKKTPTPAKSQPKGSETSQASGNSNQTANAAIENIRQIGLIQKDEFDAFYQPIIDQVEAYAKALTHQEIGRDYFEIVFKALRKRRSTIFEFGSSEADQSKRAAWTYGLFASLSIRHIAALLNRYTFHAGAKALAPSLLSLDQINTLEKRPANSATNAHKPNTLNLHLIDKVLPQNMIQTLDESGIYPSVVNAVTGYYFQPLNPFYQIIEDVERYVNTAEPLDETTVFKQTLDVVLDCIARNVFSKNRADSGIFEGQSYLLIDRCLLWEVFRSYSAAENDPLSKSAFEITLCQHLEISGQLTSIIHYTVSVVAPDNEPVIIELRNMLALPYQKIPLYSPAKPKRIGREVINRNLLVGDRELDTATQTSDSDQSPAAPDQPQSKVGNKERVTRTSNEEPVVVGDLFSSN